jgi:hypothetical protein
MSPTLPSALPMFPRTCSMRQGASDMRHVHTSCLKCNRCLYNALQNICWDFVGIIIRFSTHAHTKH